MLGFCCRCSLTNSSGRPIAVFENRGLDASRSAMMLRLLRQVPQEALAQATCFFHPAKKPGKNTRKSTLKTEEPHFES